MPRYSVVLRVHNEKREAINTSVGSVLCQTLTDWEALIIDDGSEKETWKNVDLCAEKDNRIRVIHQENRGGLGAFRRGINEARGEYLAFLDAGDAYEPEFLESADEFFRSEDDSVDMVSFGLREVFPDHDRTYCIVEGTKIFEPRELIRLMERTVSYYALWIRVTKRSMFRYSEEEEHFYDQVGKSGNFGDDLYLLSPVLLNCRKIVVTDRTLYRYQYDGKSISRHYSGYTWQDAWNRNRLIEFTYNTLLDGGYIDKEMIRYLRRHALLLQAPCAKWIVRHGVRDRGTQRLFRENAFFSEVVFGSSLRNVSGIAFKEKFALVAFRFLIMSTKN